MTTLDGRQLIPIVFGEYQEKRRNRLKGQTDLTYINGEFHLYATIKVPEGSAIEIKDLIGIDMGIVERRRRFRRGVSLRGHHRDDPPWLPRQPQAISEAWHQERQASLRKMKRRESRFRRDVNHRISKKIVTTAKDTGRGISLEDLTGIRDRTTVRAEDRAKHSGWSFFHLRAFVEYKARWPVCLSWPWTRATPPACAPAAGTARMRTDRPRTGSCVSTAGSPATPISTPHTTCDTGVFSGTLI